MFHNRRFLSLSSAIMMQQTAKNAPTKTPDKNNHIQNTPKEKKGTGIPAPRWSYVAICYAGEDFHLAWILI